MSTLELSIQFFFQVAVILTVCQIAGFLGKWIGQPQVVSEMIAGVILGPSLFGLFLPELYTDLFPKESMKVLFPVSQLGLASYMFIVGTEFRIDVIQRHAVTAFSVSLAGMLMPFVLGGILAWYLVHYTELFSPSVSSIEAIIFMGSSMCITAFPMLARIIHFKGLAGTTMGTVALGAGAIDDAAAWCLLAIVLASFDGDPAKSLSNIGAGAGYVAFILLVLRPLLARYAKRIEQRGSLSDREFAFCLALMSLGAWFTDRSGLHAVFGGFMMGVAMPRGVVTEALSRRMLPLNVALLLPMFFTYSGLSTRIDLLDSPYLWGIAGLVLVAAIGGKGIACWLAARASGMSHRDALGIGVLMNARGLMELIVINIGLERGIISPTLFATLVIMAVITTLMASPLFEMLVANPNSIEGETSDLTDLTA